MTLPRLYPILDTESLASRGCGVETAAKAMLEGGAGILQLRHKGHFSRQMVEAASRIGELCKRFGALWVINDRADMALVLGAGLHVGQDDLPPVEARALLGAERVLGFSTHNEEQLLSAASEPVDYLALGPIFTTASKERPDPVVGLGNLSRWRALTDRTLVAIGGITRRNAASVLQAGADSVAVIADLLPEPCNEQTLRERMNEWQQLVNR